MVNVKDPGKDTRGVRPLVPRSSEQQLALYAQGPDDLDAALAGLSREDLDQARAGQWTIICLTPGRGTCRARLPQSRKHRALTVGQMVWRQATHALEHIDEIRQARHQHGC